MKGLEIERKYLVRDTSFLREAIASDSIDQGYLHTEIPTVRVRTRGEQGFLTIKGASDSAGLIRAEYEYPIPLEDAKALLALCTAGRLTKTRHLNPSSSPWKTRHLVPYQGYTWEVDVFHGELEGLILAELELDSSTTSFPLPPWIGEEVTGDPRYYNSYLASCKQ